MRTRHEQHLGDVQYIKIWQRERDCLGRTICKVLLASSPLRTGRWRVLSVWGRLETVLALPNQKRRWKKTSTAGGLELRWRAVGIIKGAGWKGGGRWGDEVRVSALKLCQEVCVWANELGEEVLSQEPRPREGPVVLASPPRTHVTMVRTPPPHWSHNMCTTRVHMRVYTQGCDAKYLWHQITPKNCRDILISKKEKKKIRSEETKFKFVHVNDTLAERCTFEVIY